MYSSLTRVIPLPQTMEMTVTREWSEDGVDLQGDPVPPAYYWSAHGRVPGIEISCGGASAWDAIANLIKTAFGLPD